MVVGDERKSERGVTVFIETQGGRMTSEEGSGHSRTRSRLRT